MKEVKLGQVCNIRNGFAFKSSDFKSEGIPIIRIGEIKNGIVDIRKAPLINQTEKFDSFIVKKNDILIAMSGATTGKIGKYTLDEIAYQNQRVGCFIPKLKELDNDYLYQFLSTISSEITKKAYGGGQPNISTKEISKFLIPLPSIDNQKRIAQVLSNCDTLILKRKESIGLLDELLKSTFLKMFGKRKGEGALLGDEIDIQTGLVNPNELPYSEMFHVGGRNIESNTGKISNLIRAKDENLISGKYLFEEGYLLYSKIRPNLNKVTVMHFTGICSADVYPIKPKNDKRLNIHFLRYELMAQRFLTYAINNSGRANIPKINRKTLNAYRVVLPSIDLQNQFSKIVMQTETIRLKYESHLQELENLYGSISQKAFKGELDLESVIIPEKVLIQGSIKIKPVIKGEITVVDNDDLDVYNSSKLSKKEKSEFFKKKVIEFFSNNTGTYYDFVTDYLSRYDNRYVEHDHDLMKKELLKLLSDPKVKLKQFFDKVDNTIKHTINEAD